MHSLSLLIICVLLLSQFPFLTQAATKTVLGKFLRNVEVNVEYIWSQTQSDLDTATLFVKEKAGFNCPSPTDYIVFSGDRTGVGRTETALVLVSKAVNDGKTTKKEKIVLYAHWHNRDGNGATAQIRTTLRDATTKKALQVFQMTVTPADNHSGCSSLRSDAYMATVIIEDTTQGIKYSLTKGDDHEDRNQKLAIGGCRGDPHCNTFDNLKYDCQGTGEFILSKIADIGFEAQVRYGERLFDRVTLTTGFAMIMQNLLADGNLPLVQVSISKDPTATTIGSCQVQLFVDRAVKDLRAGFDDMGAKVVLKSGNRIVVSYPDYDISMHVYVREWNGRCFLEGMRLQIPDHFFGGSPAVGLLGSLNGNAKDDWTTKDGTPIAPPQNRNEELYKRAYDYCVQTWCNRDASKSLFEYEGGKHKDYDKCDLPFGKTTDITNVPQIILNICGADVTCQVEGVLGGPAIAQAFRQVTTEIEDIQKNIDVLFVDPTSIPRLRTTNVKITVNISAETGAEATNIDSFALYTINADTKGIISYRGRLFDDGSSENSDLVAGDKIFSNSFRFFSTRGATSFSLRLIPVIENVEQPNSKLVYTALNTIDVV